MIEKEIKVLKVSPYSNPETITIDNDYYAMQEIVSEGCRTKCNIEIVDLEDGVCLICNEEGKILGLPYNRRINGDMIAGTFFLSSEDDEGNLASLSNEKLFELNSLFGNLDIHFNRKEWS